MKPVTVRNMNQKKILHMEPHSSSHQTPVCRAAVESCAGLLGKHPDTAERLDSWKKNM